MRIVIIGNGIAGITAARHIRKASDAEIIVISGESKYFFSRTALMYIFMGHMKFEHTQPYENWFWRKNKIQLLQDWVDFISPEKKLVALKSGEVVNYDKLIIATGSTPADLPIPGSKLRGVQSLYTKQDLELMEQNTVNIKSAVIIGGGLIGIEMAEMLHTREIDVTMVIREDSFWNTVLPQNESAIVTSHIRSRGVKILASTTAEQIIGDIKVDSIQLSDSTSIKAEFVGITIGVQPNIQLVTNTSIEYDRGILVNEHLQTNIENIYAIGDCAQLANPPVGRRAIEPVWYTGRIMGETVAESITGKPREYEPGHWFNSAKFFDLEYQTYGHVPPQPDHSLKQYYWEDLKKEQAFRLVCNTEDQIIGINAIGLRLRQEVCESWISSGMTVDDANNRLNELNFNPEFFGDFKKLFL